MNFKPFAILDIGTNTVSMIIAQKDEKKSIKIIDEMEIAVFLGRDGFKDNFITPEGKTRLYEAFEMCKKMWEKHQISTNNVKGVATSVFRNAKNGQLLTQEILADFGFEVKIISGDQEAEYIYHGVKESLQFGEKTVLLVDIGGGSVECILGNKDQIFWKKSIEIGAARLKNLFGKNDPLTDIDIQKLDFHFELAFAPLTQALSHYSPAFLAGSAGCFETISAIYFETEEKDNRINQSKILVEDFFTIYQQVINAPLAQRQQMKGMSHRADMIPFAISLIKFIVQKSEVTEIQTSSFSLREGFFLKLEMGNN